MPSQTCVKMPVSIVIKLLKDSLMVVQFVLLLFLLRKIIAYGS